MKDGFQPIRGLILDMDGVLWLSDEPIGDLPAIFQEFARLNIQVALASNNATRSVESYLEKLSGFGVLLKSWQIINSSLAAANYLGSSFPNGGPVFIIGESGLIQTLDQYGFYPSDEGVLAVIASMDRQLTYAQLRRATLLIRAGAQFIGTNPDRTFPTPEGLVPGAGAILAALEAATDVKPVIVGKPSPEMYRLALRRLGTVPEETLVIGDRLETDIVGAQELGCRTALVLSGVTSETAANKWTPPPDWIIPNLAAIIPELEFSHE